jgi:hypothetical protein
MDWTPEILEALGSPFPQDEVEFLPRASSGGSALALPYIDARSVMRRLDAVVGAGNWSFDFDVLSPDGKRVKGRLTVLGVTKCDAGEASGEDEPLKSAVSDALKRCAVHFGVGRYLYYLPRVWAPYDSQKRRFTEAPKIDPTALGHALSICGIQRPPAVTPAECSLPAPSTARSKPRQNGRSNGSGPREGTLVVDGGRTGGEKWPPEPRKRTAAAAGAGDRGSANGTGVGQRCDEAGCRRPLTPGQFELSRHAHGRPLCPACQRSERAVAA